MYSYVVFRAIYSLATLCRLCIYITVYTNYSLAPTQVYKMWTGQHKMPNVLIHWLSPVKKSVARKD